MGTPAFHPLHREALLWVHKGRARELGIGTVVDGKDCQGPGRKPKMHTAACGSLGRNPLCCGEMKIEMSRQKRLRSRLILGKFNKTLPQDESRGCERPASPVREGQGPGWVSGLSARPRAMLAVPCLTGRGARSPPSSFPAPLH